MVHHIARLHPPRADRVHTRHSVALAPAPGLRPLRWPTWHRGDVGGGGSWALWPRHPEETKQLKHQETAGTYGGTQGIPKIVSHHGSPQPSSTLILSVKIDINIYKYIYILYIYKYDILFQLQWFLMFFITPNHLRAFRSFRASSDRSRAHSARPRRYLDFTFCGSSRRLSSACSRAAVKSA